MDPKLAKQLAVENEAASLQVGKRTRTSAQSQAALQVDSSTDSELDVHPQAKPKAPRRAAGKKQAAKDSRSTKPNPKPKAKKPRKQRSRKEQGLPITLDIRAVAGGDIATREVFKVTGKSVSQVSQTERNPPPKSDNATYLPFIRDPEAPDYESDDGEDFNSSKRKALKQQPKEKPKRSKAGRPRKSRAPELMESKESEVEYQTEDDLDSEAGPPSDEEEEDPTYSFSWKTGNSNDPKETLPDLGFQHRDDPKGRKGKPNMDGAEFMRPSEIFMRMVDGETTFERVANQSNLKYQQFRDSGGRTIYEEMEAEPGEEESLHDYSDGMIYQLKFLQITYHDVLMFLAICFAMAYCHLAEEVEYWGMNPVGPVPAFMFTAATKMSYNRWRQIKKFFCFTVLTPDDLETSGSRKGKLKDKCHRSRYFINVLQKNFKQFWSPGWWWSIDEGLFAYYGRRCPIKVFMKGKPQKYGIKSWCLNCAYTGYLYAFHIYAGSGDFFVGEDVETFNFWHMGERVVIHFAQLLAAGCFIFTDRFFTTPRLCVKLLQAFGVWLTGTCMRSAPGLCQHINWRNSTNRRPRGYFNWAWDEKQHVVQICWMDRKPVIMCSSIHGANFGGGVQRLTRPGTGKLTNCHANLRFQQQICINLFLIPSCVVEGRFRRDHMQAPMQPIYYNGGMGGTDYFDKKKQNKFSSLLRNIICKKWPLKLDLGLLDMAATNTYIIYKQHHPRCTHREFMRMFVHEMFQLACGLPLTDPPPLLLQSPPHSCCLCHPSAYLPFSWFKAEAQACPQAWC